MQLWSGVWGHDHTVLVGAIYFINSKYSAAENASYSLSEDALLSPGYHDIHN